LPVPPRCGNSQEVIGRMSRMRKFAVGACVALALGYASASHAASAYESDGVWMIETDGYTLHFKTDAQAGYSQIFPTGGAGDSLFGAGEGRNLYHSANYSGWSDWGPAATAEVAEDGGSKLVMHYVMDDGNMKVYDLMATHWDGVPYWKHELTITARGDLPSFGDGHEPMVEPRNAAGDANEYAMWADPFSHVAFANPNGYFAMYTESGEARTHVWEADGRMDLVHDSVAEDLSDGGSSSALTFYLATGPGGLDDAAALVSDVTTVPSTTAVDADGKLTTTWGSMKSR